MHLPLLLLHLVVTDIPVDGSAHLLPPEEISVEQLQTDLKAVRKLNPSLAAPIIFMTSGFGVAFGAGVYFLTGTTAGTVAATVLVVIGGLAVAAACVLVAVGAYMLFNRIEQRVAIAAETRRLTQELQLARRRERDPFSANEPPVQAPLTTLLQF